MLTENTLNVCEKQKEMSFLHKISVIYLLYIVFRYKRKRLGGVLLRVSLLDGQKASSVDNELGHKRQSLLKQEMNRLLLRDMLLEPL